MLDITFLGLSFLRCLHHSRGGMPLAGGER
jgi:hypothetical protein